jgi:dienelactone hydrolase
MAPAVRHARQPHINVMKKIFRGIGIGLLVFVVIGAVAFGVYVTTGKRPALPAAQAVADAVVRAPGGWIEFKPNAPAKRGVIVYPGGLVDEAAYAPLSRELAQFDALVVLVPMPFELAVFDIRAADRVVAAHPEIDSWYIAGHSLGGSMACQWISENPAALRESKLKGVMLWGSYCASDISSSKLRVLSLVGENDSLVRSRPDDALLVNLPPAPQLRFIPGGNHAMFGDYGLQGGDGNATRDLAALRADILKWTGQFLVPPG